MSEQWEITRKPTKTTKPVFEVKCSDN